MPLDGKIDPVVIHGRPGPQHKGIRDATQTLAEHDGLVRQAAHAYSHPEIEYDDLYQAGVVGLLEAAESFDPDRGCQFSTWAYRKIREAIKRQYPITDRTYVSQPLSAARSRSGRYRPEDPNDEPTSDVDELNGHPTANNTPVYAEHPDSIDGVLGYQTDATVRKWLRAAALDEREQLVIAGLYAGFEKQQVADEVGVSIPTIKRIERAALEKIRRAADIDPDGCIRRNGARPKRPMRPDELPPLRLAGTSADDSWDPRDPEPVYLPSRLIPRK